MSKEQADHNSPASPDAHEPDDAQLWDEFDKADQGTDDHKDDLNADADDFDDNPDEHEEDDPPAKADADDDKKPSEDDADPWKDAPEHLRKAYEDQKAKTETVSQQWARDRSRVSSLTKKLNTLETKPPASDKKPADGDEDADDQEKAKSALDLLQEEYPEIGTPIIEELSALREQVGKLTQTEQSRLDALMEREESTFLDQHPDGFDVITQDGPAFMAWVEDQPKSVRDAAFANADDIVDGAAAAQVVGLYKEHIGQGTEPEPKQSTRRQRQLQGARTPTTRGPSAMSTGIPDTDDEAAIWKAMDREDAQKERSGRR